MNTYYVGSIPISDELYHHGIKGQKWGIRRYQNEDGTLTAEGKARYKDNPRALFEDLDEKSMQRTYDNALNRFKQQTKEIDQAFKEKGGINDFNLSTYLLSQELTWKSTYLEEITKDYGEASDLAGLGRDWFKDFPGMEDFSMTTVYDMVGSKKKR